MPMPETRTERQPGHKAGALRREILTRTAELKSFLDRRRASIEYSLYTQLSDDQWEQFCDLALTTLIPGILIGKMRGMRVGFREQYSDELGDYQPCSVEEAIEWFKAIPAPHHDIFHAACQVYMNGSVVPDFLSGNVKDIGNIPSVRTQVSHPHPLAGKYPFLQRFLPDTHSDEEGVPFALRHALAPSVIEGELYVTLFGGQNFPFFDVVPLDGQNEYVMLSLPMSFVLVGKHPLFTHFVEYNRINRERHESSFVRSEHAQIDDIYRHAQQEDREITQEENWHIFLHIHSIATHNQVFLAAKSVLTDADIQAAFIEQIPAALAQVISHPPDELKRLYLYIDSQRDSIVSGGTQMFELLMAMGNMDTEWLEERDLLPDRLKKAA